MTAKRIFLGGPRLLEMIRLDLPEELMTFQREANQKERQRSTSSKTSRSSAECPLADVIRPESKRAVEELHAMGVEVAMLTGDSNAVARTVAEELKIDRYFAEVLPNTKIKRDRRATAPGKEGRDGRRWSERCAGSDSKREVGIAIGSGTDVAIESAGIILMRSNPLDIVKIIRLSRASYRKMYQNLWWAAGYNIVALPLAAGILGTLRHRPLAGGRGPP
ncbi:MAG: HAD family hydrolase (plasmid) [Candidatus Manganitrophus sp.]|nr:MAG: HAD family hydrolase [Candidatus Manganitrophus sp.]